MCVCVCVCVRQETRRETKRNTQNENKRSKLGGREEGDACWSMVWVVERVYDRFDIEAW